MKIQHTNRFCLCIILVLSGIGAMAQAGEDVVPVNVATYNVEFGKNASPEQIGEMFKPYELDLIGFCEAPEGDWTSRVGKVLDMKYAYVGKVSSANHKDKYKTILSRTPLELTEEFTLTAEQGWNPASVVKAETTIRGIRIAFYSLHICASGKDDGHAHLLSTQILPNEKTKRIIVVGDFNNKITDPAITTIMDSGMTPTWKDLKLDLTRQFTWNVLNPEQNAGVIDHIFYNASSGARAIDGGIIELEKPLSDHKPIWAKIAFPKAVD